jgi:hypothetical protein
MNNSIPPCKTIVTPIEVIWELQLSCMEVSNYSYMKRSIRNTEENIRQDNFLDNMVIVGNEGQVLSVLLG